MPKQAMCRTLLWMSLSRLCRHSNNVILLRAGRVLYNWRVFPIHLKQPPVAVLNSSMSRIGARSGSQATNIDQASTHPLDSSRRDTVSQAGPRPEAGTQGAEAASDAMHNMGRLLHEESLQAAREHDQRVWSSMERESAALGRDAVREAACDGWPGELSLQKGPIVLRCGPSCCKRN